MYTREQIETGQGRYNNRGTTILQKGDEDIFETAPRESGWICGPGFHVAGYMKADGEVVWCDLR